MADRTVVYRIQADVTQARAQMASLGASVKKSADDMTSATKEGVAFRQSMGTLGDTAGKVGLVAAAGLGLAAKASIEWESAWAGVTKTVDGSAAQMSELEGGLRGLAKTLPATHEEIAGVAEAAGQLGVAREDILSFTKTMIDLGETTNLTAEEAATSIAQISNVMGTTGDEVDNFGSALVALGNDGASTEKQILDMTQRIAGAGAQIGLAETDILAIANAAASMGIEAEAGGSAISRVFTELAKATASGGPKLEQFAQTAGVTSEEFVKAFGEDPARAFEMFTSGLDGVNKSGGDVFTLLKSLGMSDVRVSQALLGMAASGDLLSESLDLGKQAWEENTALAVEAAKRYDTTASEMQVAWNQIKDAGIEAGDALLPVVAGIAEGAGTMADAFGNLPAPVKNSATALAGVTAVLGGGLWFTSKALNGVASMRGALDELSLSGGKSASALGKVAKGAGLAAGAFASFQVVDSFVTATDKVAPGMEQLTRSLLDAAAAAEGSGLSDDLVGIGDSINHMLNPEGGAKVDDFLRSVIPGAGDSALLKEAKIDLEALDTAIANIANNSGLEASEAAFMGFAESLDLTISEQAALADLMPQYKEAIAGIQNESGKAAEATDELAGASGALGGAVVKTAEQLKAEADALEDARKAATDTAGSFFNLGDSLNDASVSLGDWISQMANQADALNNFTSNAKKAANDGLRKGLIAALKEAGPEGALRMKQLANATEGEIDRANAAWDKGQRAINKYVDATAKVPKDVSTTVNVASASAMAALAQARRELEALDGKTANAIATITTVYKTVGNATDAFPRRASGGPIYGPGTKTSDSIPAMLSNGEYVIRAAAVEKYGLGFFDQANQMRLAGGGSPDRDKWNRNGMQAVAIGGDVASKGGIRQLIKQLGGIENALKRHEKASERQTKAIDTQTEAVNAEVAKRDEIVGQMAALGQATTAGFQTGLFDSETEEVAGDPAWMAGGRGPRTVTSGGWMENLSTDIAGLMERSTLQTQLKAAGLDGAALEEALSQGSNEELASLLAGGAMGVQGFEAMFNQRAELMGTVGAEAGQLRYGTELAAQQVSLDAQTAILTELKGLEAEIKAELKILNREQRTREERREIREERNADRTGEAAGAAMRGETVKGHRDKRNRGNT